MHMYKPTYLYISIHIHIHTEVQFMLFYKMLLFSICSTNMEICVVALTYTSVHEMNAGKHYYSVCGIKQLI
jgi:hypothetical protein